jgi:hypothetical protein
MYILGLFSSWGTSWTSPAWSPSEHQLTPALSPIWGSRPKPRRPEEVVYSPNDSCLHFTQRLFPPKLPQQHTWTVSYDTFNIIHVYYTSHLHEQLYLLFTWHIHTFILSDLHGRLAVLGPLCPIQYGQFIIAKVARIYTPNVKLTFLIFFYTQDEVFIS